MNTAVTEKISHPVMTTKSTTTLFDLIASMQDHTANTTDDALIVPTVAEWIRSGRIKFQSNAPIQTAAQGRKKIFL